MSKHTQRLAHLTNLYFTAAGIVGLAVVGFIFYPAYSDVTLGLDRIAILDGLINTHESQLTKERDTYRELKDNYLLAAANRRDISRAILPIDLQATTVVRTIETTMNTLADNHNPATLKSVTFGRQIEQKDLDYITLPFKVSINTTKNKLNDVLRFFERSGTFLQSSDNSTHRLLDIREVSIQSADPAALQTQSDIGSLDIDLSVNAYAQADSDIQTESATAQ